MIGPLAEPQPSDVVYTWVDGSRPRFRAELERALTDCDPRPHLRAFDENRFRPTVCLRYSLRSILKHGAGLGRIFVVTNGERPEWLQEGGRLIFVDHAEIIDAACLPTFNSNAIEWRLRRIRGLSDPFVYFNDDVMLTDDFSFANGMSTDRGPTFSLERWGMPRDLDDPTPVAASAAFNANLLDERFGGRPVRLETPHEPLVLGMRALDEIEATWPEEIARTTAARFRSRRDFVLPRMYVHFLFEQAAQAAGRREQPAPRIVPSSARLVGYGGSSSDFGDQLRGVARDMGAFLCVNDELGERCPAHQEGADNEDLLEAFLERLFPTPGPWERDRHAAKA